MQLKILEALNWRGELDERQQFELKNRLKGRRAEQELRWWVESLNLEAVILSNELLNLDGKVEFDLLILARNHPVHLEVKNYEGQLVCRGRASICQRSRD